MLRKVGGCKNELKESLSTLLRSASIYHVRAKGTKEEANIYTFPIGGFGGRVEMKPRQLCCQDRSKYTRVYYISAPGF